MKMIRPLVTNNIRLLNIKHSLSMPNNRIKYHPTVRYLTNKKTYLTKKSVYDIKLIYDTPYWAYYWQCLIMQKYAPPDLNITIEQDSSKCNFLSSSNCDLVFQMVHQSAENTRDCINRLSTHTILTTLYSLGWNYNNQLLTDCLLPSDFVVCNNVEMWEKFGKKPKTYSISNGVDLTKYYVSNPIKERKHKVLWIGSVIHRRVKNYDSIIIPLSEMLRKENIPYDLRLVDSQGPNKMNQDQMKEWYNSGTIYVVPSSCEGTPCPLLESSACGCVPVSTRVGNAPELITHGVNGYLCDTNAESLFQGIKEAVKNQTAAENMQTTIKMWDWKERSEQYFDLFRKLIEERVK
jgi:glycosyltransferase involved in cell wall biosynthesis